MNTKAKTPKRKDEGKAVAFAYFSKNKFLGWYADTFGSLRAHPKVYRNSDVQIEVITRNFNHKLNEIARTNFKEAKGKVKGLAALGLLIFDSEDKLRGKEVELRIVELPFTDNSQKWLSLNRDEVALWASKPPRKFIKTIKHNKKTKKEKL